MPFFYYYDPTYILVLIGAVLSLWASATVKSTYNKYSRVYSYSGLTGAQAAAQILRQAGIYDVRISFPDSGGAAVLLLWCTVPADHFAGRV